MEEPFWTARVVTLRPRAVDRLMRDRKYVRRRRNGSILNRDWECAEAETGKNKQQNVGKERRLIDLSTYA
jgi:hypothetical protein